MPGPVIWNELAKDVSDNTSIQEAIDAAIVTHNADISAHQEEDEAIFNHKSAENLDHLDGSITFNKLPFNKVLLHTAFESLDGWSKIGNTQVKLFETAIYTNAEAQNAAYIVADSSSSVFKLNPAKNPFFQTSCRIGFTAAQLIYILAGKQPGSYSHDSFGFKVSNSTLYAYWTVAGTQYTEEITGVDITEMNIYRASMNYDQSKLEFSVNGILAYTETVNLPTDINDAFFQYYVKTTNGDAKDIWVADLLFQMDR